MQWGSKKGWSLIVACFAVVFAFSTVDHAISPLVEWLKVFFSVGSEKVLWLISSCTAGIVLGLFVGPQILKSVSVNKVVLASLLMMGGGIFSFVLVDSFYIALAIRTLFGLGAGLFSTVLWWLAYEAIDKKFYVPMITVLTASRPMAVAAGVPLVMVGGQFIGWRGSFAILGGLIMGFCLLFMWAAPADTKEKISFTPKALVKTYISAWKTRSLPLFFTAMFINRLCYFGFYSFLGLWFIHHYSLTTEELAKPLMVIGICETLINFVVPVLMKIGPKKLFYISSVVNIIAFSLFIFGKISLWGTIGIIGLFAMTDRIYNMLLLVFIPTIFKDSIDRTTIGSLVTLVSWMSLMVISWWEGISLRVLDFGVTELLLLICLIIGLSIYSKVLRKTLS